LSALGVVFGDIGTSPLYTLKTVLALTGDSPDAAVTLGALSLVVWTLIVVTTIKYVSVAMRVDNDGEGGIPGLEVRFIEAGQCNGRSSEKASVR
jgi:KUP system potassium uptake protein